jgi:hypothetical protein
MWDKRLDDLTWIKDTLLNPLVCVTGNIDSVNRLSCSLACRFERFSKGLGHDILELMLDSLRDRV